MQVTMMSDSILAEVADLLENALNLHPALIGVVLSTREGVVVASVLREETIEPTVLSTVSAALVWSSITTMSNISRPKPSHLIHYAGSETVLIVLQHQYQLVCVFSDSQDDEIYSIITELQSIGTRIEILMRSAEDFGSGTILGRVVEAIPTVDQGMVLTIEGMPISSIGLKNDIEIAALIGSIFANGLTYSELTDSIIIGSEDIDMIIQKLDEKRLLVVIVKDEDSKSVCKRINEIIQAGI